MALTQIKPAGLSKPVDLADNEKIRLGTGTDLQIYHDGSNSYIDDTGTGDLNISGSIVRLQDSNRLTYCRGVQGGTFELYHNNALRSETTSTGSKIHGQLEITGSTEEQLMLKGTSPYIRWYESGTAKAYAQWSTAGYLEIYNQETSKGLRIGGSGVEVLDNAKFTAGSSQDLQIYHDGSNSYISETGTGSLIIDSPNTIFQDGKKVVLGTDSDLQIYHDGTRNYIDSQSIQLRIETDALRLRSDSGETYLEADANGAVKLYYDNSKKLETASNGGTLTGDWTVTSGIFLNDDGVLTLGTGGDYKLYHDGSTNYIESPSTNFAIRVANGNRLEINGTSGDVIMQGSSGRNFTWDNSEATLNLSDNAKLTLGGSNDLTLYHNGSNSYIDNEVGSLYIRDTSGAERVRINGYGTAITGGLLFGTDTAAANALHDYEEGTFTFSFSGGINITNNEMAYTKIGRFVMCTGRLTFASGSGSNTTINMDGLPFTPASLGNSAQGGVIPEHTRGSDGPFFMAVESSTNKVRIRNGASQTQSIANFSGESIRFQLTYFSND